MDMRMWITDKPQAKSISMEFRIGNECGLGLFCFGVFVCEVRLVRVSVLVCFRIDN